MANLKITIRTSNAAFNICPNVEIARIFNVLAEKVGGGREIPRFIYDINGNKVGLIDRDEESYDDDFLNDVVRMFKGVAETINNEERVPSALMDINGYKVGEIEIIK